MPTPPRSRVTSQPSGKRINSISLEATPRRKGQTAHPLTRSPYVGIKSQQLRCSTRVRRHQAATPHSNSTRSPVRQLRSLLPGAVATLWEPVTHCADVLGTALATVLHIPSTSSAAGPSNGMGTTLGRGPNLDPIKTPACRTLGMPPRQSQGTVLSAGATMPPAGAARTPA